MSGEWKEVPLNELYEFASGLSKPRSAFGSGYPFLSFKDVFYRFFVPKDLSELVNSTERERARCSIKRGDVFLTRTSETMDELGMSCVALRDIPEGTFNGFTKRLRPKEDGRVVPEYAGYFFRSPAFRQAVTAMSSMSTRASLNNEMLARLSITLPSLEEQASIGHILGSLDDKIELNCRMNETLEAMARVIFKDWFVDFGPVRAKAEGKRPPGLAPEIAALFPHALDDDDKPLGWGQRAVYRIAEFINGAAYKNMHFSPERDGLPVIKIAELKSGISANTKFTTTDLGEKYRIDTREILFSWSGNPDTSINTFIWADGPAWLNQHIFRVRENGSATLAFIYFQLKELKPVFAEIARNKQTTGLGHVTARDMKELMVCDPSKPVIDAFEAIAHPMFLRIIANLLENRTLAQLRDLLLPKLLSGKIRFREAEKAVEAVA